MINDKQLTLLLNDYNYCRKFALADFVTRASLLEQHIYKRIEDVCIPGKRIKLKDGTFGTVRRTSGFSVQLERARTDICTWFLIDELLK